ncbi:hypothetical protein [Paenibacillus radicibacter]|uniref:hypothetical protein n=1 Tax=Paenibacillus radicibacter TaxID=2972488 RepID=UPI002158A372|nr:hypothetical protein [Paenibacillus radicibacter]
MFMKEVDAYYVKNVREQSFGDLHITNERTIFHSKRSQLLQVTVEFLHSDVLTINTFKSWLFIPTGLRIRLRDGQTHSFKINPREEIIRTYKKLMNPIN